MFSIKNGEDNLFKIVLIFSFFLLLVALGIIVHTGPVRAYEFSIYDAYPWYFWVLILSAIFCGQLIILGSAITPSRNNYWIFGLCVLLVANSIILFMPLIREYYLESDGDILSHIGFMKDLLHTASIGGNHYPIDHILVGVIAHLFSGLSFPYLTLIIPPFFSFFFILSLYFVGKMIFSNRFVQLMLVIISSVLMFGQHAVLFMPNAQAFFLVPLILYAALKIYYETDNKKYYILLFLLSFFIVFYHPLVTVLVILILCLMQVTLYVLEKYENRNLKSVNYIYTIFFIVIVFTMWSTYLSLVTSTVALPIAERLLGNETGQSELQSNIAVVSLVKLDPIYFFNMVFNMYGNFIIMVIFSLLSILFILKSIKEQKTKPDLYIGIPVVGFIIFFILAIFMFAINGAFNFERIIHFSWLFSFLLVPTGIYLFLYDNPDRMLTIKGIIKLSIIISFFFGLTYFSIFNLFPSPIIKQANTAVIDSEYKGMSTFFAYRNQTLPLLEYVVPSFRYHESIYGRAAEKINILYYDPNSTPPDHFGYQNVTLSHNFYNTSQYLLLDARGRGFYSRVYPEYEEKWRFLPADFERLNFDSAVQNIYDNGNLEVRLVGYR